MALGNLNIRLEKLVLNNFRGFRSTKLSFDLEKKVIVLIADNGMGKTSILDAVAEFLRYLRYEAIYSVHRAPVIFKGEINPRYDVTNGTLLSSGEATFEIEYPFISAELFEWIMQCINWLNDVEIPGNQASLLYDEEETGFVFHIIQSNEKESDSNELYYFLPEELRKYLEGDSNLIKQLEAELIDSPHVENVEIDFAYRGGEGDQWQLSTIFQPDAFSSTHKGKIELRFYMNAERPDSLTFEIVDRLPADENKAIEYRKQGKAFIEDFKEIIRKRSPYESRGVDITLPLLVYYGGSAINTRFDKKLKLPYCAGWFQPYSHALEPDRFDFAEFFSWAMYTEETAPHQWRLLKKVVLDVLNPPGENIVFSDLLIEAQELVVEKMLGDGNKQKVKLKQLSSGEKNILALVADLTKRAIQLNPHLVPELHENEKEGEVLPNLFQLTPGIVLIDEIDLHLHPKWQSMVVAKLQRFFPNIQFLITTHSPFVLQSLAKESSTIIKLSHAGCEDKWEGLIGWTLAEVAEEAFNSNEISGELKNVLRKFRQAVLYDDFAGIVKYFNWIDQSMKKNNPIFKAIEMQYEIAKSIYHDEEAE